MLNAYGVLCSKPLRLFPIPRLQSFTIRDAHVFEPDAFHGLLASGNVDDFLRHVERCTALLHVIDCGTLEPKRDPLTDLDVILTELGRYPVPDGQVPLLERPQLIEVKAVVLNGRRSNEFAMNFWLTRAQQDDGKAKK